MDSIVRTGGRCGDDVIMSAALKFELLEVCPPESGARARARGGGGGG